MEVQHHIYLYKIMAQNIIQSEKTIANKISHLLKKHQFIDSTIDLRCVEINFCDRIITRQKIHLVSNRPLSKQIKEKIVNSIQQEPDESVKENFVQPNISIEEQVYDKIYLQNIDLLNDADLYKVDYFPIPRLSHGPMTGNFSDSWNRACDTIEAKNWLKENGVKERLHFVALVAMNYEIIHSIGFVK